MFSYFYTYIILNINRERSLQTSIFNSTGRILQQLPFRLLPNYSVVELRLAHPNSYLLGSNA